MYTKTYGGCLHISCSLLMTALIATIAMPRAKCTLNCNCSAKSTIAITKIFCGHLSTEKTLQPVRRHSSSAYRSVEGDSKAYDGDQG